MRFFWATLLVVMFASAEALPQLNNGQEQAKHIASTLPSESYIRRLVESGNFGDGVEHPWQTQMRQFGVRAAAVEVRMIWFFGPKWLRPVRIIYYASYDGREQITDSTTLDKLRAGGLESQLKGEAVRLAPDAHWVDVPFPIFWPFRASTTVGIWDNPWLPTGTRMFTTFGPGRPPLVAAVGAGDLADVNRLLANGTMHREQINQALWYACSDHDPTILRRLIQAGAEVNQLNANGDRTCLTVAIASNSLETVKVLLGAGAKVDGPQAEDEETPLMVAASNGASSVEIVKLLLNAGANIRASNSYGLTPLMMAAGRMPESPDVLELLIGNSADVNAKDHRGRTALTFARERNNNQAFQVLKAAGAKE